MIVKLTTRTTKLITYPSNLSCLSYDDPSNLLDWVRRAQFDGEMTPVIYQKNSGRKIDDYNDYVGLYRHVIPPSTTYVNGGYLSLPPVLIQSFIV